MSDPELEGGSPKDKTSNPKEFDSPLSPLSLHSPESSSFQTFSPIEAPVLSQKLTRSKRSSTSEEFIQVENLSTIESLLKTHSALKQSLSNNSSVIDFWNTKLMKSFPASKHEVFSVTPLSDSVEALKRQVI